jgi:hypothetical protein
MRSGKVAMLEVYDMMKIPDEFSMTVKGDEENTIFVYQEKFIEPRDEFFATDDKGATRSYDKYRGMGTIVLKGMGARGEILAKLFNEMLLQLKFYLDDEEIREMVDNIKVLSGRVKK